ncbi:MULTISPECIES: YaaR family protein [Paenibacillus]|uniref:YaaR family protein n=1 Tax=Paenibacillus violae TaxID=3077234 RepID=A0ABU3RPH1_9BACL|nr:MULTISPECIES: YaaR family protein [Paenibacillus]MDU0206069.1 YaaR family protein [Paenibacillus sp. PFR10]MEC0270619.1 YaaR family protein [Paenibacillus anseongense]
MKINPGWQPIGKNVKVNENVPPPQMAPRNFSDIMQQQDEKFTQEQLSKMVQQITLQGDRLSRGMTVRELLQYKLLIKQFLEETARRGVNLRDTKGWDRRGRSKRYKLLEEIDQELLTLADELLESEQGRIEILQKIGEIRGMLINLLF